MGEPGLDGAFVGQRIARHARSVFAVECGGSHFRRSEGHSGSSLDLSLGSIPGREVACARSNASFDRRCGRRVEFLPVQCGAATGAPCDVDVQQDTHPVGGCVGLVVCRWRSCAEQLAAPSELLPFHAIGQQAVMPDAQEMVGKHVLQEAVEEFLGGQNIRLEPIPIAAISKERNP